ncbi:gamma-glutamyl phosphate reductase [Pleurocapsa sp. PCC 7327]|uniref:glutamate-5-semialdehyde dehydrogenase n=1 Tax=Pleurocapsa sp. PCC 7327 TaxID=118163 RepID=UPI00029F9ECB|nr:glutamate-5-semialdehyde dehydrogenase [Pleurocapsa sp. PCC 7327]AFY76310.1 gamma-glutamyl phosphate reductase [Pleurocapsa sp. PCC 7327]
MTQESSSNPLLAQAKRAHNAFVELGKSSGLERNRGVKAMVRGLQDAFNDILEANTLDLEMSREMAVPELILEWLKLTPKRLQTTVEILQRLAELPDPLQQVIVASYQLTPFQTYCQRMPLGTIALIHEAFPELGAIAAGLCLKTGNSLILRGCSASSYANAVIAKALQNALEDAGLPAGCIEAIPSDSGSSIQELVTQDQYINLVIPYGRPSLVEQVTQLATAPVLKSAMGNCYLYWSLSGDLDLVRWIVIDSHGSEPDPVNAIEKVLIGPNHNPSLLVRLFNSLQEKGFELRGDKELLADFSDYLTPATEVEWGKPYLDKIVAFKVVGDLSEAIAWINRYSSGHADCLVTESYQESRQFAMEIDSALVYINSSPRFSRNPKQGESVFLGISNQKGHRRGLISLETFTTLKQVVQGNGKY